MTLPPSRAGAIKRLADFIPRIPAYASQRNFDRPVKADVSCLSAHIRRRLITEQEVVGAVLKHYSFERAEKFVQEVVWRTYWKGWLERHPHCWFNCLSAELNYRQQIQRYPWSEVYNSASQGRSELDFFNQWVRELVDTGYLHNHTRMWFASVWIFTLRIPWQLGAMFMYRHLLDGDPASNTLSWRWVAGLQTKGKSYLATAENIAKYSEGRWRPKVGELAKEACQIEPEGESSAVDLVDIVGCELPTSGYALITTSEDLSIESEVELFGGADKLALLRQPFELEESSLVGEFVSQAEADALARWGAKATALTSPQEVVKWSVANSILKVVLVAPSIGAYSTLISLLAKQLADVGVELIWYRREWDKQLLELADKGFFPYWERVKKRIGRGDVLFSGKSELVSL